MNLIGDFIHNITDGLVIGVLCAAKNKADIASSLVAIVAHEIPQEIGDVGILLHSKFTPA